MASSQDHALKANALATFVEAAMRISPHTIDPLPACKGMESIINGSTQIRLGRPLVAFFATCESVEKVKVGLDIPSDDGKIVHAEFICDPRDALQQIGGGSGAVLEKWNHALDWSLTCSEEIPINSRINDDDMRDPNDVSNSEFGRIGNAEQISEAGSNLTSDSESVSKVELDPNDDLNSLAKVVEVAIISPSSDRGTEKVIRDMGVKFSVGKLVNSPQGDDAFFWPGNTSLNQMNIGVVGDLGTGKTQLVKTLISQVCATARDAQPTPVTALILDYKKDYKDEKFIADVRGKVLRPHKIPLNIFGISGDDNQPARFRKAQAFRDVIKKIYGGVGPVQAQNLTDAIMNVYAKNDGPPTVNEVAAEYNLLVPRPDAISSILGDFVNLEIFSSDKAELKSLSELMDGSVLVLCLDELEQDTFMKNSLATLFLNQYFEYMQGLTRWPFQGSHPNQLRRLNSYLVVDEATNVMNYGFPVLMNLLLQGREFGVGVLLSSQFLSHFRVPNGENYGQPLLTWFIHKVPDISRAQLSGIGLATATEEDINKIKVLPPFSALYKSLNYSGKFIRGTPFFELRP